MRSTQSAWSVEVVYALSLLASYLADQDGYWLAMAMMMVVSQSVSE